MNDLIKARRLPKYIEGDELSLKISSYPIFLKYLSNRLANKFSILLELCTGIAVGLIFLESNFRKLYGVELDSKIVKLAKRNIEKSELKDKLSMIQADVNDISDFKYLKPDVVIYDIPYWSNHDVDLLKRNPDLKLLFKNINKHLTKNIIIYSPPHFDYDYYKKLLNIEFELVEIYINKKHDRNVLFFGNLVNKIGIFKVLLVN